jgi:site-specific DNA recombinase
MAMTKPKQKRAVLYARYSTSMQKATSIDGQFALCRKIAKGADLHVVGTFEDRAKSGQSEAGRDGYAAMLEGVRRHDFDVIVVESLDRLSRDRAGITRVAKLLEFHKVEIRHQHGVITSTDIGVQVLLNSIDKGIRADKSRRGHDLAVSSGKIPGAVTYGYRRVLGMPGEREIDPAAAEIVRRIFREYAAKRAPRDIALDLTREGVKPPGAVRGKKHKNLTTWNYRSFVGGRHGNGMIGNRLYIGELNWNTHSSSENPDTEKKVKRANPTSEHLVVQVPHLRIIDQDLWEAAIKVRESRSVQMFGPGGRVCRRPVVARNGHLLSGLMRCGECGSHMRIACTSKSAGGARLACAAAHQHGTCKVERTYALDQLMDCIRDGMVNHLTSDEAYKAAHEAYRNEKEKGAHNDSERDAIERKLNALNLQIERLADTAANLAKVPQEFYKKIDEKEAERASLNERLRLLGSPADNVVLLHPKFKDVYRASVLKVHTMLTDNPDAAETRAAFRDLIDSIIVHPTAKRMPYEITPYARLAALMGQNLFPEKRSTKEVFAAQGLTYFDNVMSANTV